MDSQIDTASPLWLVLAAFALLFIVGSHPLELWKALQRGMQMLVQATANASRLAEKAVVIGMVFAGLLLAPLQGHVRSMSPEEQSIWSINSAEPAHPEIFCSIPPIIMMIGKIV